MPLHGCSVTLTGKRRRGMGSKAFTLMRWVERQAKGSGGRTGDAKLFGIRISSARLELRIKRAGRYGVQDTARVMRGLHQEGLGSSGVHEMVPKHAASRFRSS